MMATLTFTSPMDTSPRRNENDLASFFWRQVVAKSPEDATPSLAYEHGWNALNELIRSDRSWSGYERNVMFANNRDGTFTEVSGAVGLDFPEDSRSFALADIDHDGRLEVILKNRNAPQLRILHNGMKELGSIDRVSPTRAKEQSRCHRNFDHNRGGDPAPDKVFAGRVRVSCPALERNLLWSWKAGRQHPGHGPLAKWAFSEI